MPGCRPSLFLPWAFGWMMSSELLSVSALVSPAAALISAATAGDRWMNWPLMASVVSRAQVAIPTMPLSIVSSSNPWSPPRFPLLWNPQASLGLMENGQMESPLPLGKQAAHSSGMPPAQTPTLLPMWPSQPGKQGQWQRWQR